MDGSDGGTTFTDSSWTGAGGTGYAVTAVGDMVNTRVSNHSVTANAHASIIGPKVGSSAIDFDGNGDYLEMAASSDWNFGTGDLTIECWAYFNDLPDDVIGFWQSGDENAPTSYNEQFAVWWWGGKPKIGYITNGGTWSGAASSTTITAGSWWHLAWSRSGGYMRGFLNGV